MVAKVPFPQDVVQFHVESMEELRESDVHLCPRKTAGSCLELGHLSIEALRGTDPLDSNAASLTPMKGKEVAGIPSVKRTRLKTSFWVKRVWLRKYMDPSPNLRVLYPPGSCPG